jgi:ABC-2 type transport system ATP-binding protein
MLTLNNLSKRYGPLLAVDNVSLDIADGEFFGLLGPNGAGKSTLMSLIAGLKTPDVGAVIVAGRDIKVHALSAQRTLGLVPQSIALFTDLTAEENLRIFGELQGLRGSGLTKRIDEALEAVQLIDRRRDLVSSYSGGMQRRLNLVAALLHRPQLLLCDEPTVGVDPQSRNAIFDYLERLNAEGLTIVYSTHYMEEAERLCSRIGIIDQGRILALGSLSELLTQLPFEDEVVFPASAATAALAATLGAEGTLTTRNHAHRFQPRPGYRLSTFFSSAETLGLSSRLFEIQRPSLEAVFLHLTGRNLRD